MFSMSTTWTNHAQLHSCHLTSRDALSWVSCLLWFCGCAVCISHGLFTSGTWFGASQLSPLRLICSFRVSWIMSAVLFSTIIRPSCRNRMKLWSKKIAFQYLKKILDMKKYLRFLPPPPLQKKQPKKKKKRTRSMWDWDKNEDFILA